MTQCGGCGADAPRTHTVIRKGQIVESCPACHPEDFAESFGNPLDKIVTGYEASPHLYYLGTDGEYHAKDELLKDMADSFSGRKEEEDAIRKKQATRRTTPMSAEEEAALTKRYEHIFEVPEDRAEREYKAAMESMGGLN